MRIFGINISRQTYPKHRFWELFNPTVLNFGFWIATATFLFFWYDIFARRAEMYPIGTFSAILLEIVSNIALGVGALCVLCLLFLFFRWILGIKITKHKPAKQELVDIDHSLEEISLKVSNLKTQLDILNERIIELKTEIRSNEAATKYQ